MMERTGRGSRPARQTGGSGQLGGEAKGPAGAILRGSGKDGPQAIRSGGKRWTEEAEEIFLDCLAASNNLTWAAEKAGFSRECIYKRARRDPGFGERMAAARAMAQDRLDELLLRTAEDFLGGRPPDPETPFPPMTVQDAIAIVKLYRPTQTGEGKRPA